MNIAKRSAAGGVIVWLVTLLLTTSDSAPVELIHKVLFFAMLVIVPLALSVVQDGSSLYKLIVLVQPVAALLTVASFFFDKGILSATLASSWLIVKLLVAFYGLARLSSHRFKHVEELSIDAGLFYLTVAGTWLVIYRLGVQPFGYGG